MCSLGARYSMYCANIARTYLVDPSAEQEAQYKALLAAQEAAIAALVVGAPMGAAHTAALKALQVQAAAGAGSQLEAWGSRDSAGWIGSSRIGSSLWPRA
jgi:nucleosome binding factor SPN SPT16 subunit